MTLVLAAVAWPLDTSRTMTTAIVQGGVPGGGTDVVASHRQATRNHREATWRLASRTQAPETALFPTS